ncbi:hypothetical protein GEMRC1_000753 [Eukaryota sp. GEM-RC1]
MFSSICGTSSGCSSLDNVQPTFDRIVKPIPVYPIRVREEGIWAMQGSPKCYVKMNARSIETEVTCAIANPLDSSPPNCFQIFPQYSRFSFEQNDILMNSFMKDQRPDVCQVELLSQRTGLTVKQVKVWHQNRRNRLKRSMKKSCY